MLCHNRLSVVNDDTSESYLLQNNFESLFTNISAHESMEKGSLNCENTKQVIKIKFSETSWYRYTFNYRHFFENYCMVSLTPSSPTPRSMTPNIVLPNINRYRYRIPLKNLFEIENTLTYKSKIRMGEINKKKQ